MSSHDEVYQQASRLMAGHGRGRRGKYVEGTKYWGDLAHELLSIDCVEAVLARRWTSSPASLVTPDDALYRPMGNPGHDSDLVGLTMAELMGVPLGRSKLILFGTRFHIFKCSLHLFVAAALREIGDGRTSLEKVLLPCQ